MLPTIRLGLVSVTFRHLSPIEIIAACETSGLGVIEWGGDIHVPPGRENVASEVGLLTREAGLEVSSYGSYYRLGSGGDFRPVLDSALALGAPIIRVWAGEKESAETTDVEWVHIADNALRCADLAWARGMTICYEFHGGTLTHSTESALNLLDLTKHPGIATFWQPPNNQSETVREASLSAVLPHVRNVHVFNWLTGASDQRPLDEASARWRRYFSILRSSGRPHDALLEFVKDGDPDVLPTEASSLRKLIAEADDFHLADAASGL